MKGSFNDRVRQVVAQHIRVEEIFRAERINELMELSTQERKRLRSALHDLSKYGEIENLGQGRWRRLGREERPELREIMWRLLRIHLVMTVEDMTLQSGASSNTAREFFEALINQGLAVNEENRPGKQGRYRLVKDLGPEPPRDKAKAEKLRQIRARKKQQVALTALDGAFAAVAQECPGKNGESLRAIAAARMAVSQLEEG